MTQAEKYEQLFQGGNKAQAENIAERMSVWKTHQQKATVYGFADDSAIYTSGPVFRVATPAEVSANN